jgi:hypothetical protein
MPAMTARDLLAESLLLTKALNARYLAGFDEATRTRQATNLPNHAAWSLGHLALTMHRVAQKVDGREAPSSDFAADTPDAFDPEAVAFGSVPNAGSAAYPSLERCVVIYNAACDRLALAVRSATEEQFNQVITWGPVQTPWWSLIGRMIFHNGFHTGQIADLRRALAFKPIFSGPMPVSR